MLPYFYKLNGNNTTIEPDNEWVLDRTFKEITIPKWAEYLIVVSMISFLVLGFLFFRQAMTEVFSPVSEIEWIVTIVLLMPCYMIFHEGIHLIHIPPNSKEGKRFVLFSNGNLAVFYNGAMTIKRYLLMVSAPLIYLSVGMVIGILFSSGPIHSLFTIFLVIHIITCMFDMILVWKILKRNKYRYIYTAESGMYFKL